MYDEDHPPIPPWETLETGAFRRQGIFRLQQVVRRSPRTGRAGTYQVLHLPDWANVIALTPGEEVVLVEQYRHGTDEVTWEIPGGVVEEGEEPARAAARELLEETGYRGGEPLSLGIVEPNPAFQTNACSTWLIREARPVQEPTPDEGEHIAVRRVPLGAIPELLRRGKIRHSLVVAAFHWLALHPDFSESGAGGSR